MNLANPNLRWLDNPMLRMDHEFVLSLGYAQGPPTQVFSGNIVSVAATFPQSGGPAMTVTAQDRRQKLKEGNLRQKYDVIIFPHVGGTPQSQVNGMPVTGNAPLPYKKTDKTPNLGFVDQSHLAKRFKGAFGITPGAFAREQARGILPSN